MLGQARICYLAALFRARHLGSLDGVLRATEAFAGLGDTEMARSGLHIARTMAGPDPASWTRVEQLADRLGDVPLLAVR